MPRGTSTRRALASLGFAATMALTTMVASPASADRHDGLIPEGDWTDDQIDFMLDLIDETEQVLPEQFPGFPDPVPYQQLEDELGPMGFSEFGVSAPGGYDHWINQSWMTGDGETLDPYQPESLVYRETPPGSNNWKLVSAMYMLAFSYTVDDIPDDIAFLPGWHVHPELCVGVEDGGFRGVTDPENPSCPDGSVQSTGSPMMHVWIVDNDCNHRFGGVGVSGLHCDHDSHNHDDGDGHSDGHDGDGHDDGHDGDGHHGGGMTTTTAPTTTTTAPDDGDDDSITPQAQPVPASPSFTG